LLDTLLILKAHALGEKEEPETISTDRLAGVLSRDWGFWHTVTANLQRIREYLKDMTTLYSQEPAVLIAKLDRILFATGQASKSLRWKFRALVGTRKKWYNPVETDETVGGFGIWQLREPSRY
jgi:hypothetical protein